MNKLDANYLKWAKESNRKSTLRNFLISELVAFEKEMNHFDAKDF